MTNIIVPLAEGFEEIEAVAIIDVLRRGGLNVTVLGIKAQTITGAHGLSIVCDGIFADISADAVDMIVLPGGSGGTRILTEDPGVQALLREMDNREKPIGAICAAPLALKTAGVLKKAYTCYPGTEKKIGETGYDPSRSVVEDGNIMTSRGPGTAICFGLEIVRKFKGEETYRSLRKNLLAGYCED
jgi:4-methyl-5(b-hydroxyethyl)-thiazole monophosphate biosynthesis